MTSPSKEVLRLPRGAEVLSESQDALRDAQCLSGMARAIELLAFDLSDVQLDHLSTLQ